MTGYSISRYKEFPKIVGGIDENSTQKAFEVYSKVCSKVSKVSSAKAAELIKVAEGLYRDVNIALANEIYKICQSWGLNFWEIRKHANHKFCAIHEPGSVGGHCIPVYPWFIINQEDVKTPLLQLARKINDEMVDYYISKIEEITPAPARIAIVGLSYREGVKEKAYARSIPLINSLSSKGYTVYGYDQLYSNEEIKEQFSAIPIEMKELKKLDCIIIFNELPNEANELKEIKEKVIDVKNSFHKEKHTWYR